MESAFRREKGFVRLGLEIGDCMSDYDSFLPFIREHYDLEKLGFILFFISPPEVGAERFYEWARFCTENDICFAFLYTQQRGAPVGRVSHLTPEIVRNIKEIAGEYFMGDMIGETGGLVSWPKGYYAATRHPMLDQTIEDMRDARDAYVNNVAALTRIDKEMGVDNVLAVEATCFSRYNFAAGVDYTSIEMMCGNPEIMFASARGACAAYHRDTWGCHIAHEWYGGFRNDDPLKYKRLRLAYNYAYLSGANLIYPESGDFGMRSYGYNYEASHPFCQSYRDAWNEFGELLKKDKRPATGPTVKVAFVYGNLDSYAGWGGTSVWGQFDREEWGYGAPENSWKILDEVNRGQRWHDTTLFGESDLSAAPGLGLYDILPCEAPAEVMSQYEYLIFAGWNSMTEEVYENLKKYVSGGGKLLLSAAHLNTSTRRDGELALLHGGKLSDFLGCDLDGGSIRLNSGVKFFKESLMDGVLYPATGDLHCDPICPGGFASYAKVTMKGGRVAAALCDVFQGCQEDAPPALVEHRYGKGVVSLMTNLDYPGSPALFPFYRTVVKELLHASHRSSPVKVHASDKISFAVYPTGENTWAVYLLNTDYDMDQNVKVEYNGKTVERTLSSMELARVDLK